MVCCILVHQPNCRLCDTHCGMREEFGWRAFLLSKLQIKYSSLTSSVLVGIAWGLWHIPTQVIAWRQEGFLVIALNVFITHIVGITAQSIVMTWIYNNTNQNLLLIIMMHYSIIFTAMFMFPLTLTANTVVQHWLIYNTFYWFVAVGVVAETGSEYFVRGKDTQKEHRS